MDDNKDANASGSEKGLTNQSGGASPSRQFPDLVNLRLSQDFLEGTGIKKPLVTVPVRKPHRQEFIRVHPDAAYRFETMVLDLKEEREVYLVDRALWPTMPDELVPKLLVSTMTRQGVLLIWPIRLPNPDGRHDAWNSSALEAAQRGQTAWIRLSANMSLGAYDVYEATGAIPDPVWPDQSFAEILKVAFQGRYIDTTDHPVLRRLRGEV